MEFYKQPEAATIAYVDDTLYKLDQFSNSKNGSPLALGEATVGPWLLITKQTRDPKPRELICKDYASNHTRDHGTPTRKFYFFLIKLKNKQSAHFTVPTVTILPLLN